MSARSFALRTAVTSALIAVPFVVGAQNSSVSRIEQYLESLRQQAGIPGLAAAIVQDGTPAWERGFGEAEVERSVPVFPDTPFPIAGLTAAVSAVQALQCVERGLLTLETRIGEFLPAFPEPGSTLLDVLSHMTPARRFNFDPPRYDAIAGAIKHCTGNTLRSALANEILGRLGMNSSVPGHDFARWSAATRDQFPGDTLTRYANVMARLAKPYRSAGRGRPTLSSAAESNLTGASGLVSTVRDLARFQAALDAGVLLRRQTLAASWTPPALADGRSSPHALGWFVQTSEGQLIVWQFGVVPDAYSSLVMTLPAQRVTMILLANSDDLVDSSSFSSGDISASPFARLFIRLFS
jgi:CubicO group peptidase (beta-lactamase class C family)